MNTEDALDERSLDILFREARTHRVWVDKPVSDEVLRDLYELLKWGPTSANTCPARFLFLCTHASKQRLAPALSPGNVQQTMAAPVTAIVAYDLNFYEKLPRLFPHDPGMRDMFAKQPDLAASTAFRNGTLEGGYFILAARALGLDCGPMSGFDNAKVDAEFFQNEPAVKSNFLCNLGYGDREKLLPRSPRLEFKEACTLM